MLKCKEQRAIAENTEDSYCVVNSHGNIFHLHADRVWSAVAGYEMAYYFRAYEDEKGNPIENSKEFEKDHPPLSELPKGAEVHFDEEGHPISKSNQKP